MADHFYFIFFWKNKDIITFKNIIIDSSFFCDKYSISFYTRSVICFIFSYLALVSLSNTKLKLIHTYLWMWTAIHMGHGYFFFSFIRIQYCFKTPPKIALKNLCWMAIGATILMRFLFCWFKLMFFSSLLSVVCWNWVHCKLKNFH